MVYEFYRVLGIPKDATDEEIKKAYKHLALFYNPKRHSRRPKTPDDPLMSKKEKAMKEMTEELHRANMYLSVSEAYDILNDPQKRAIYDQFGERALKEGLVGPDGFIAPYVYHGDPDATFKSVTNFISVFINKEFIDCESLQCLNCMLNISRQFFGTDNPFAELVAAACAPMDAFVSKESQGFRPKDQPILKILPITYEDAYNGALRKILLPKRYVCGDGSSLETRDRVLTLQIPPGAVDEMEFNFPNEGDESPSMQPADIIFRLQLQPHPVFKREVNNLVQNVTVNLYEALCGVIVPVNTLDGRSFRVYNVHLIQPGYEKLIKGEGMPILEEPGRKGDLIIRFKVRYPNKLDAPQRQQLKAALDPQFQTSPGGTIYDRKPPATLVIPKKCICPEVEEEKKDEMSNE
ncbi:unnamed protein product [Orchesella dallaii]|uniref:J domain-containing protein n=1 Tax=Orchesella dallaii TaxID=48710 RepID=A0ABP1PX98_9HEXA